jgi:hypothetical protein
VINYTKHVSGVQDVHRQKWMCGCWVSFTQLVPLNGKNRKLKESVHGVYVEKTKGSFWMRKTDTFKCKTELI